MITLIHFWKGNWLIFLKRTLSFCLSTKLCFNYWTPVLFYLWPSTSTYFSLNDQSCLICLVICARRFRLSESKTQRGQMTEQALVQSFIETVTCRWSRRFSGWQNFPYLFTEYKNNENIFQVSVTWIIESFYFQHQIISYSIHHSQIRWVF